MKEIDLPQTQDQQVKVIQQYFYGAFPNFQMTEDDGSRGYRPYYCQPVGHPKASEPNPMDVVAQHVLGEHTWATRAVQGDRAYFAALDVDTIEPSLLEPLRVKLYETYEWTYNWEESESGLHIWFLWEDSIPLFTAIHFIQLLDLPPHIEKVIDK